MNSFRIPAGAVALMALSLIYSPVFSQVDISIDIAPPPLIVEDQPPCPEDGLLWTPGYWAYDDYAGEYYWVPGAWVEPPQVGFLWTPAYWGWSDNVYVFHQGYWGPTVGFYGGINYGHGYWGRGYGGGRWDNGRFAYNTAANNVNITNIHNTYVDRSVVRANTNRVSFNGGRGGVAAQPTPQERQVAQQNHVQATAQQQQHFQAAAQQRSHEVKVNKAAATAGNPVNPTAGNAATPATAQSQVAQKPTGAASPLSGWDTHKKKENVAGQNSAPAANTPAVAPAPQPAVNKPGNQFTGGGPQHKEHKVNPAPVAAVNTPTRVEEKPHVTAPPPALFHTQTAVNHPAQVREKPHVQAEHPEAGGHAPAQHMTAPAVQHVPAPQVRASAPQAQPHPQASAPPQAKAQGPGAGPGRKDDGH